MLYKPIGLIPRLEIASFSFLEFCQKPRIHIVVVLLFLHSQFKTQEEYPMLLEGSHFIHLSPNRVFTLLNDPEVLARCVPGVKSLVLDGTDSYKAQVEVAIGPVIAITEKLEPERLKLSVEFKSPVGIATGTGVLRLEPEVEGTRVHWAGEPQLMGMIASVGARLIGGVAKVQADLFFSKLELEAQALETV
jgi:carbon monoxide dehydrogenase subunit G